MTNQTDPNVKPEGNPKATTQTEELSQEIKAFAGTLEKAVRSITSPERARALENELRQSFTAIRQQTEAALKDAKVTETAQELGQQAKSALNEAKVTDAASELGQQAKKVATTAAQTPTGQKALTIISRGLAAVNQQLERLVQTEQQGEGSIAPQQGASGGEAGQTPGGDTL
ncbi:MAG: hypothetical protein U0822_04030 [Anaerolineae bacterium]